MAPWHGDSLSVKGLTVHPPTGRFRPPTPARAHPAVRLALGALLAALPACGAGDGTLEEVDPGAAPAEPTYEEHIAPIMEDYCTACHGKDAGGEGGEVRYDTCQDVLRNWGQLARTAFEDKSMPPPTAYTLPSADVLTLKRWKAGPHVCP